MDKYPRSILLMFLGEADKKTNAGGFTKGHEIKHDTAQEAEESQDCFSLDVAFNEIVVNEA